MLAWAGLWVSDVLVQLGLLKHLLLGKELIGGWRHWVGLALTDAQIALGVTIVAMLAGALRYRLPRALAYRDEVGALVGAALAMLPLLAQLLFPYRSPWIHVLLGAGVPGLIVWFALRSLLGRAAARDRAAGMRLVAVLFPGLLVGLGYSVILGLRSGASGTGIDAGLLLVLITVGAVVLWRPSCGRNLIATFPVHLSLLVLILFSWQAARYGNPLSRTPPAEPPVHTESQPSLVLIVLDTVRADHLRLYGYERNTMPNLSAWSTRACVLERAVSPAGWTAPAHASLFSGLTVSQHGVHYGARQGPFLSTPQSDIRWLPALLAEQGYACLAVTANSLALPQADIGFHRVLAPTHREFDYTLGAIGDRVLPFLQRISERLRWRVPYADAGEMTDIVMRALSDSDRPLFLFINLMDAHSPYNPPGEALRSIGAASSRAFSPYTKHRRLTSNWRELGAHKTAYLNDLYDGELFGMDVHLGRLLPHLEQVLGDGSLIIVTSDHGEELGEEDRVGHEFGLAQRLLHVPLIIRGPDWPAARLPEVVTLRRLFDVILAEATNSASARRILASTDSLGTVAERYPSREASIPSRAWVALFEGRYKAVGPSESGGELFDLETCGFRDGCRAEDPAVATSMFERVDQYWYAHRDTRDASSDANQPTEEELEKLRSLGYIH